MRAVRITEVGARGTQCDASVGGGPDLAGGQRGGDGAFAVAQGALQIVGMDAQARERRQQPRERRRRRILGQQTRLELHEAVHHPESIRRAAGLLRERIRTNFSLEDMVEGGIKAYRAALAARES